VFAESTEKQPILRKWTRIVEQMDAFSSRIPGNSVQRLHEFVTKDLALMDAKEILNHISVKELKSESGDFFEETLLALKKGARSRAELLLRQKAIDSYLKLALYFNQNLKGKFPFVTSNLSLVTEEADPDNIREFYRLYNEAGGNAETILNQLHQLGSVMKNGTQFFQTLDMLKQFFGTYLDPTSGMPVPAFDFAIDFRANRSKESGADMVVDWVFKPNDITKINKNDKLKTGRWVFGNEVKFTFRWPDGAKIPAKPERDPAQPNLSIEGRTAVFTFKGNWGLLWALRMQNAASEYGNAPNKPSSTLPKFSVPNGAGSTAVLFNAISLTVPALTAHTKGQVMRLPDFPAAAPELPQAGELYAERAVLTEGVVQASSMLKPLSSTTASVPSASPQNAQKQGTPAQSQQQPNPTKQAKAQGH
jgi:type VI secretion system protein ImpL